MNRAVQCSFGVGLFLLCVACPNDQRKLSSHRPGRIFLGSDTLCQFPDAAARATLSSEIPADFDSARFGAERNLTNLQCDFDVYSWETFVAMNWPADANGNPDPSQAIGSAKTG